jgi:hypothetical protein
MKCLSVMQPWATLLVSGAKRYETRSWRTNYRGLLAIHASRTFPPAACELCRAEPFRSALLQAGVRDSADLPRGQVIGTVELVGCIPGEEIGEEATERAFGDYRPGRWAWACLRPGPLAVPFVYPGGLGVFEIPDHLFFGKW